MTISYFVSSENTHILDTEDFPDQKVIAGMCKSKTNFYFK